MKSIFSDENQQNKIDNYECITSKIINNKDDDIAIIGMGLRMPMAENVDEFWDNIKNGIDCVTRLPEGREKDILPFLEFKGISNPDFMKCSYINSIDGFDYKYFNLTPKEAELMDPINRMFLETTFETIESAGYLGKEIRGSNTGVYIGAIGDINFYTYKEIIRDTRKNELPLAVTGTMLSMMGGMLSHTLDLRGPAVVTDTACSSSLVAIHNACNALKNRECDMALACGARLQLVPLDDNCFKIGIESSDGVTRTFDAMADGSGYGEGIGVLMLKPLRKAKVDGDIIHGVIKGSAINQDGASLRLTSPNPDSQERVLAQAWKNAKINPEDISYIECHGTGTKLGDPIEVSAITKAFNQFTDKKQFCAVGSIKSNIGHLLECSGVAGVIKSILAMKNKQIPPTINFNNINPSIDFVNSAIYPNTKLKDWITYNNKRYCGVSSFGISGVNCHMVIAEGENPIDEYTSKEQQEEIFVLSSKTKESLKNLIKKYAEFLEKSDSRLFENICYTTNIGKEHYENRIAVIAENSEKLRKKLILLWENDLNLISKTDGIWINDMNSISSDEEQCIELDYYNLIELCEEYINGNDINWRKFYKDRFIKKVSVPTYKFERKKCWIHYPKIKNDESNVTTNMFYRIEYKESLNSNSKNIENMNTIIFSGNSNSSSDIVNELRKNNGPVYDVKFSSHKKFKHDEYNYIIKPDIENFIKLFECIDLKSVDKIIYNIGSSTEIISKYDILREFIEQWLLGGLNLIQAISKLNIKTNLDLVFITDSAYKISDKEKEVNAHNAALVGFGRNINLEFSNIKCRVIDKDRESDLNCIINEIYYKRDDYFVAFRNNKRYIEEFVPVEMESIKDEKIEIKQNGIYIITGGLGNIGLRLAEYLALQDKVKLILVSRKGLIDKCQFEEVDRENSVYERIRKIEELGSEVVIVKADVSDEESVRNFTNEIREKYGDINGIIHAAGVTGNGYIATRKKESFIGVINPKIYGTWLLDRYTQNDNLDFFVMCSSGVAMIGEVGLADYTAANAYLDSFSSNKNNKRKYIAIDWVIWEKARMGEGFSKNVDGFFKQLNPEKAIECFEIAINKNVNRVLVGEINYNSKFLKCIDNVPLNLSQKILSKLDVDKSNNNDLVEGVEKIEYSNVEKTLSQIVSNVLGYESINIYDNFFELGGNSILLNYIWTEIDKIYPNKIMISDLFAYPSIDKLSKFIMGDKDEVMKKEIDDNNNLEIEEEIDNLFNMLEDSNNIEYVLNELDVL